MSAEPQAPSRARLALRLAGALAAVALACAALVTALAGSASAAPPQIDSGPVHGRIVGQNHFPEANRKWTYSVTVTDRHGRPLAGRITTQYAYNGQVVGTEKPANVPFRNGLYHDTIIFPPRAIGYPLAVRCVVRTSLGTITLDWTIKVMR